MTNRRRATAAALALATASVLALSACSSYAPPYACADWVQFDDAQAMYDEASLVIEGTVHPANGELAFDTGPGILHPITVEVVLKGDFDDDTLEAASPRDYCVADPPQPAEDPLREGERVLLFLHTEDGEWWSTLTPHDGVLPFAEGTELPFTAD